MYLEFIGLIIILLKFESSEDGLRIVIIVISGFYNIWVLLGIIIVGFELRLNFLLFIWILFYYLVWGNYLILLFGEDCFYCLKCNLFYKIVFIVL